MKVSNNLIPPVLYRFDFGRSFPVPCGCCGEYRECIKCRAASCRSAKATIAPDEERGKPQPGTPRAEPKGAVIRAGLGRPTGGPSNARRGQRDGREQGWRDRSS